MKYLSYDLRNVFDVTKWARNVVFKNHKFSPLKWVFLNNFGSKRTWEVPGLFEVFRKLRGTLRSVLDVKKRIKKL